MSAILFEKIIHEATRMGIKWINLQFYGEPLLDNKIFERIRTARTVGIKVKLNTNASLLHDENILKLLDTGIEQVNISFDAFNATTYNAIRLGLNYDKVIKNIRRLIHIRNANRVKTKIVMTYVCLKANMHEALAFKNEWKKDVDKIILSYAQDWAGNLEVRGKRVGLSLAGNTCKALWKDLVVLSDGRVALCCQDYEGAGTMGDISSQSLEEIWNGPNFLKYRHAHKMGERQLLPLCASCEYYSFWYSP